MDATLKKDFTAKTAEVLEQFAFLFCEAADIESIPQDVEPGLFAEMEFSGDRAGFFSIACPASVGREIAANLMGIDSCEAEAENAALDSLRETLNVVGGHWITTLFGEDANCRLSAPSSKIINQNEWRALREKPEIFPFMIDDAPMLVEVAVLSK